MLSHQDRRPDNSFTCLRNLYYLAFTKLTILRVDDGSLFASFVPNAASMMLQYFCSTSFGNYTLSTMLANKTFFTWKETIFKEFNSLFISGPCPASFFFIFVFPTVPSKTFSE